jgi:trk system potassium uptake protein TrkH
MFAAAQWRTVFPKFPFSGIHNTAGCSPQAFPNMKLRNRDRFFLLTYFISIILAGSLFLWLPASWKGAGRLSYIDALFTSTSAVCVTGLTAVDTSLFSFFGKSVILLLIQFGGLGIITFTTIFLVNPRGKISLANRKLIGDYYLSSIELNPRKIIRSIIILTLAIELLGAVCLFPVFHRTLGWWAVFSSIFHAVSAFCNAGFSTFSDNLAGYVTSPTVNFTIMCLIVLGGMGFVVQDDLLKRAMGRRKKLALHTKLVMSLTLALVLGGAAIYLLFEWGGNAYAGLTAPQKLMASLFQSVTPRTAGFNTVAQDVLSFPSKAFSLFLMYVGASPASTGGGIKTTTFFIVLVMILRGAEAREDIRVFGRKVALGSISRAMMFALRALAILAAAVFALTVTELFLFPHEKKLFIDIVFETFSAFGTVGLSLGITPYLTTAGKGIIVLTMFAGRVGMAALAVTVQGRLPKRIVDIPEEEVLIG